MVTHEDDEKPALKKRKKTKDKPKADEEAADTVVNGEVKRIKKKKKSRSKAESQVAEEPLESGTKATRAEVETEETARVEGGNDGDGKVCSL